LRLSQIGPILKLGLNKGGFSPRGFGLFERQIEEVPKSVEEAKEEAIQVIDTFQTQSLEHSCHRWR